MCVPSGGICVGPFWASTQTFRTDEEKAVVAEIALLRRFSEAGEAVVVADGALLNGDVRVGAERAGGDTFERVVQLVAEGLAVAVAV